MEIIITHKDKIKYIYKGEASKKFLHLVLGKKL